MRRAAAVDADEDAGTRRFGRIEPDRPILERLQCGFDLAETLIDLVGRLVPPGKRCSSASYLGLTDCVACSSSLSGQVSPPTGAGRRCGRRGSRWRLSTHFQPSARMASASLSASRQRADRAGRILQPAAVVVLEKIAHHSTAGRLYMPDADKVCALVGGPRRRPR